MRVVVVACQVLPPVGLFGCLVDLRIQGVKTLF